MKVVCYILTVYFLSLTGMPCADNVAQSIKSDSTSLTISDTGDPCGHSDAADNCSTLCGCQCCHVHVLMAPPVALDLAESAATDHIDNTHHFTNTVISPFLRPPMV